MLTLKKLSNQYPRQLTTIAEACGMFVCALLLANCQLGVEKKDCIIEGDLGAQYSFLEGKKIYAGNTDTRDFEDSAIVTNGKFKLRIRAEKAELPMQAALLYKSEDPKEAPYRLLGYRNPLKKDYSESYFYAEAGTFQVRADTSAKTRGLIKTYAKMGKQIVMLDFEELPGQTIPAFRHLTFHTKASRTQAERDYNVSLIRKNTASKYLLDELYASRASFSEAEMNKLLGLFDPMLTRSKVFRNLQSYASFKTDSGDNFANGASFIKPDSSRVSGVMQPGKYNLLVFWASWCQPCRKEIPQLKQLYAKAGGKLNIASISVDRQTKAWHNALKNEQMPWPQYLAPRDSSFVKLDKTFDLSAIPVWLLFDQNNKLVERRMGLAEGEQSVDQVVENILINAKTF